MCQPQQSLAGELSIIQFQLFLGLSAQDQVFIFFASLTGLFTSSVFNIYAIVALNKSGNVLSSFLNMEENWVLHIFILQWRLEKIFIFVCKLKLTSSNVPENQQGAPFSPRNWNRSAWQFFVLQTFSKVKNAINIVCTGENELILLQNHCTFYIHV